MIVNEAGKLFCMGDLFLKQIGIESNDSLIRHVPLGENVLARRAWSSKSKNNFAAIIEVEENGEKYLMSAGTNAHGILG